MLATLTDAPFDNSDWVFETKWDGFRLVARIEKRSVTLFSRNGLIVSDDPEPIANSLEKVRPDLSSTASWSRSTGMASPASGSSECAAHHDQPSLLGL